MQRTYSQSKLLLGYSVPLAIACSTGKASGLTGTGRDHHQASSHHWHCLRGTCFGLVEQSVDICTTSIQVRRVVT